MTTITAERQESKIGKIFEYLFAIIVDIIGFVLFFVQFFFIYYLPYLFWRATGGFGRLVKNKARKIDPKGKSNSEILAEHHGYPRDRCLSIYNYHKYKIRRISGQPQKYDKGEYFDLGGKLVVYQEGEGEEFNEVSVKFIKVFSVNPAKIVNKCHGNYSLPFAAYLKRRVGADPICGGGIKYFVPPVWQSALENLRFSIILRKGIVKCFALLWEGDKQLGYCAFPYGRQKGKKGDIVVFIGKERDVRGYFNYNHMKDSFFKPIEIQING